MTLLNIGQTVTAHGIVAVIVGISIRGTPTGKRAMYECQWADGLTIKDQFFEEWQVATNDPSEFVLGFAAINKRTI